MAKKVPKGELIYDDVVKTDPLLKEVVGKNSWEYLSGSNQVTVGKYIKDWTDNLVKNVETGLWKKHRGIVRDCIGLCKNKAIIAVGAGASFNKNAHVLKQIADIDGVRDWEERDFVIIASNHQYKPMLRMGIIPDFVIAVDTSDVIYDQLCTDIPNRGKHTVFLAALQCSNKVLKEWDKQGRPIRFFLPSTKGMDAEFEKVSGKKATPHKIHTGGNVLNTAWMIGLKWLHASTYMCMGNDLSYKLNKDPDKQRDAYYADGDYSTNATVTGTGRDEARAHKVWMGFSIERSPIYTTKIEDRYKIEIDLVGTSQTLWVYKTWIEGQIALNKSRGGKFHYYNCSEGGILGVLCRDDTEEGRNDESNWFMLDEVCSCYHTMMLEDAATQFSKARKMLWDHRLDAQGATSLVTPI